MDDGRAAMILDMLTQLHGEVAGLAHEDGEASQRLDLVEEDVRAALPVLATVLGALDELAERVRRLECPGDPA